MRNRVSFSYLNKYKDEYKTYSNTVFFEHGNSRGHILKNNIKYTYIGDTGWSYVHHNSGTSYTHVSNTYDTITLYEHEYDKYRYLTTSHIEDNNKKVRSYDLCKASGAIDRGHNKGYIETSEYINTYINVGGYPYTLFPSFIEGLWGEEYSYSKKILGASTNGMLIDESKIKFNTYSCHIPSLSSDKEIAYNIRGTYETTYNNDSVDARIAGIGFDYPRSETTLFAGVEYKNLITAYVYDEFGRKIVNGDIYNNMSITVPCLNDTSGYNVSRTNSYVTLSINENNKQIGNVLIKISLDWHNNKFNNYYTCNFTNIIDKVASIKQVYFYVNNFGEPHKSFLEGDNINYAYIETDPRRANNTLRLNITTAYLNAAYNGTSIKTNHNNELHKFNLNKYVRPNNYSKLESKISYNIINNNSNYINTYNNIFKLTPNNVSFTYDGNKKFTDPSNINFDDEDKRNITCTMNIAYINSNAKYQYKLRYENDTYNIFNVNCSHRISNKNASTKPLTSSEHKYVTNTGNPNSYYNSYIFTYNITEPGKYTFTYSSKNGDVINNNELGTYIYYKNDEKTVYIFTYEGATNVSLLTLNDEQNYIIDNQYLDSTNSVDIYNFNNINYEIGYTYFGVCNRNSLLANIGCIENIDKINNDIKQKQYNEISDRIINYYLNHNRPNYNDDVNELKEIISKILENYYGINFDGTTIDSQTAQLCSTNISLFTHIISPYNINIDSENTEKYLNLSLKNANNNYIINDNKYNITIANITSNYNISKSINSNEEQKYDDVSQNYWNTNISIDNKTFFDLKDWTEIEDNFVKMKITDSLYSIMLSNANNNRGENIKNYNISIKELKIGNKNLLLNDETLSNKIEYYYDYNSNKGNSTLNIKINKNDFLTIINNNTINNEDDIDKKCVELQYSIKLNRNTVGIFDTEYWDKLGFANKIRNYKIKLYFTEIASLLNDTPLYIVLFTNIFNKYEKFPSFDTNAQDVGSAFWIEYGAGDNVETPYVKIDDQKLGIEMNEWVAIGDEDIKITRIKDSYNMQYIGIFPVLTGHDTNDKPIHKRKKIDIKLTTNTVKEKSITIILMNFDLELRDIGNLYYTVDKISSTNNSKYLFQEILIDEDSQPYDSEDDKLLDITHRSNILFNKFCNIEIPNGNIYNNNYYLLLDYFKYGSSQTTNNTSGTGIIFYIKKTIPKNKTFNFGKDQLGNDIIINDVSKQIKLDTNMPEGILLDFDSSKSETNTSPTVYLREKYGVLEPSGEVFGEISKNNEVYIYFKNVLKEDNENYIGFKCIKQLTFEKYINPNTKIWTNGKKYNK